MSFDMINTINSTYIYSNHSINGDINDAANVNKNRTTIFDIYRMIIKKKENKKNTVIRSTSPLSHMIYYSDEED